MSSVNTIGVKFDCHYLIVAKGSFFSHGQSLSAMPGTKQSLLYLKMCIKLFCS